MIYIFLHYVIRNQTAQNSLLTCQVIVWDSQRNPEHPRNWHQIHHSFQRVYKRFISQKVIQYLRIMVANPLSCQWLSMAPFCSLSAHLDTVWKGVKRCVDKGSNWSSWMLQFKKNRTLKMTCVLNSCDIGSCVDLLKFNKDVSKMMNVLLHISWSRIN